MTTTPYDVIGEKALYDMIDYFYFLVENDQRIN
ncbi:MAG: globin, partial [Staphylococcus hominis]